MLDRTSETQSRRDAVNFDIAARLLMGRGGSFAVAGIGVGEMQGGMATAAAVVAIHAIVAFGCALVASFPLGTGDSAQSHMIDTQRLVAAQQGQGMGGL